MSPRQLDEYEERFSEPEGISNANMIYLDLDYDKLPRDPDEGKSAWAM